MIQELTSTEKYLMNFIQNHASQIIHYSITRLSKEANVSTASIVRTLQKLGYSGFTEFKHSMKQKQLDEEDSFSNIQTADIEDEKIKQVIFKNYEEVKLTIEKLNHRLIEDSIQYIQGANKVYLFARGFSEMIAQEMELKLHLLGRTSELYTDPNIIKTISKRINRDDVVIFVSLNGETKELVEAAKICHINEITSILITANPQGHLIKLTTTSLIGYKSTESYFPDYEVRSRLPLQVISRILLDAYAIRFNSY